MTAKSKDPTVHIVPAENKGKNQTPQAPIQVKGEESWQMKIGSVSIDDPLLGCLVILTKIEHRPFSKDSLIAGLPLVDSKLTPELFIRAAKRADLSAQIVERKLGDISSLVLPVVLLLKYRQA